MKLQLLAFIKKLTRPQKCAVLLSIDVLLVPLTLMLTIALQDSTVHPVNGQTGFTAVLPYGMAAAAMLSWFLGMPQFRLVAYESKAIGRTAIFAGCLAAACSLLFYVGNVYLPAGTFILFAIIYFLSSTGSRLLIRRLVAALYRIEETRVPVLIYGAGTTGTQLSAAFRNHNSIDPVAFIDDNPALQGLTINGLTVYTPVVLPELIKSRNIRRILLVIPSESRPKQSQIARRLERLGVEVQVLPSFSQLIGEEDLVDMLAPVSTGTLLNRPKLANEMEGGAQAYSGRNILVSGAGGSIGSELSRQLIACNPARIVLFELSELALYNVDMDLRSLAEDSGIEIIPVLGTATNANHIQRLLADYDIQVILHAAAYKHVPLVEHNPLTGLYNNVIGTQTLAKAAYDAKIERFVLISSDKAVRPTNVMGASKRMAEQLVQDLASRSKHTVFTMVRFGNVLGSSGSVVPLFQEQISRGGPVTLTHKDMTRYFMTIDEAVRLVLLAGSFAEGGEVFVLDMGAPRSVRDLAVQLIESAGYSVRDADRPDGDIEIVTTGLRPGEKIHEELMLNAGSISTKHEKIFVTREYVLSEIEIASAMRTLSDAIANGDVAAARSVIEYWVEGYNAPEQNIG